MNFFVSVRGMSVPHTPLTHFPSNYYSRQQLLSNMVDSACTFSPPTTLHVLSHVSKEAIPKLTTLVCSVLPIDEVRISVVDDGEHNVLKSCVKEDSSDVFSNGNGVYDSIISPCKKVVKERMRRMRIGLANKGKVPWNKGRKHTTGTSLVIFTYILGWSIT